MTNWRFYHTNCETRTERIGSMIFTAFVPNGRIRILNYVIDIFIIHYYLEKLSLEEYSTMGRTEI